MLNPYPRGPDVGFTSSGDPANVPSGFDIRFLLSAGKPFRPLDCPFVAEIVRYHGITTTNHEMSRVSRRFRRENAGTGWLGCWVETAQHSVRPGACVRVHYSMDVGWGVTDIWLRGLPVNVADPSGTCELGNICSGSEAVGSSTRQPRTWHEACLRKIACQMPDVRCQTSRAVTEIESTGQMGCDHPGPGPLSDPGADMNRERRSTKISQQTRKAYWAGSPLPPPSGRWGSKFRNDSWPNGRRLRRPKLEPRQSELEPRLRATDTKGLNISGERAIGWETWCKRHVPSVQAIVRGQGFLTLQCIWMDRQLVQAWQVEGWFRMEEYGPHSSIIKCLLCPAPQSGISTVCSDSPDKVYMTLETRVSLDTPKSLDAADTHGRKSAESCSQFLHANGGRTGPNAPPLSASMVPFGSEGRTDTVPHLKKIWALARVTSNAIAASWRKYELKLAQQIVRYTLHPKKLPTFRIPHNVCTVPYRYWKPFLTLRSSVPYLTSTFVICLTLPQAHDEAHTHDALPLFSFPAHKTAMCWQAQRVRKASHHHPLTSVIPLPLRSRYFPKPSRLWYATPR
ncbi:hypothetical protein B0T21DRAFT_351558 [Apiosordaria backusii]|uniref:Uncharacterized protein n=1 Tax=Apiosordaria backusii TaxID=314023 RepID=A0AA40DX16_9PEZI|nr:hypothetical protein B0T21DRAFT_351558 [Apiosordaria backusii]